ncbi:hypothetical protein HJC23_012214 [Cyclotella cryptica]|uniref:Fungal lipase-type domain-containing protein n=1 Tax=Cyclotella cryptica TaxID=29204 RepID=A0ABD3PVH0_9STRA|eukprot:CCRYP_011247-RA/>CCRYP_011247-RA protein AED:0.06 eAED:0.06 QI:177/1/1/1/1/1/7/529/755
MSAMMFAIFHFGLVFTVSGFVHPSNRKLFPRNARGHGVLERPSKRVSDKNGSDIRDENFKIKRIRNDDGDIPAWLKPLIKREQLLVQSGTDSDNYGETDEKLFDSFPFSIGGKNRKSKIWESEMSPIVASLSGMINIEALMAAANIDSDAGMESVLQHLAPSVDFDNVAHETKNDNATSHSDARVMPTQSVFQDPTPSLDFGNATRVDKGLLTDALSFLDGSLRWEIFMPQIQKKERLSKELTTKGELVLKNNKSDENRTVDADTILRDATRRLEIAVNSASSTFSPSAIQELVVRATKTLALREASGNLTLAAKIVFDEASKAPRATAKYTAELIEFANATLAGGLKPLFHNYPSVRNVPNREWGQAIKKAAEYSTLCGGIYENTIPVTHGLAHSIVAKGKTSDIEWMITDSIQQSQDFIWNANQEPLLVRSFIIRGFDASDEEVDREGLLNTICTASPAPLENSTIQVHEGMLKIAQSLYSELERYIELTAPTHRFVFAGHSIGGSLSVLLMAILSRRKSPSFVIERVLRVFTFGSPPTFTIKSSSFEKETSHLFPSTASVQSCAVLDALQLPSDIVYGYCQPWDPIVRLFTQYDPLYPLIDDLGEDGATLYASGPSRTLRPITKAILESWEGWPRFRDNARNKLAQNYQNIGKQFMLIPEPTRYLTDRLVSVNIAVPSINCVLQVSSQELLPALNEVFSLDTFSISIIPVAIRSFVHHFYPAYGFPLIDFAAKLDPETKTTAREESTTSSSR